MMEQVRGYRHAFLMPLLSLDQITVEKVFSYATNLPNCLFFVSSQGECERPVVWSGLNNIILTSPSRALSRIEHWNFAVQMAEGLFFDTFSFLFYGDEIDCQSFNSAVFNESTDLIFNDYFVISGKQCSRKNNLIILNAPRWNFWLCSVFGVLSYAPLQKIIFKKKTANLIKFNSESRYTSDQDLICSILSRKGMKTDFIKTPFYRLIMDHRGVEKNISFMERISGAACFYRKRKMYAGLFFYVTISIVRVLIKRI